MVVAVSMEGHSWPWRILVPRKLKFSVLLPILQVAITAVFTVSADRVAWMLWSSHRAPGPYVHVHLFVIEARLIWRGVNAPAFPFSHAFGGSEILYLAAVGVLWYLVGRFLDMRGPAKVPAGQGAKAPGFILHILAMAWGILLLFVSLWAFRDEISFAHSYFLRPNGIIVASLFLMWSLILLFFPGRRLARRIRREADTGRTA